MILTYNEKGDNTKVLIWILCFLVATTLNIILGYATGVRLGYVLLYFIVYFVARKLCGLVDEREERKRQIANEPYYKYRASLWVCKKCGASNPSDRNSCQRCGTVREIKQQETENISLEKNVEKPEMKQQASSTITEDGIEIIKPKTIIKNSDQ